MTEPQSEASGTDSPASGPVPALSLVVSTRGRQTELGRLLASLAAQGEPDFEVIVVDQNPAGYLEAVLAGAALPLRRTTSAAGLSRGRNAGLRLARGRIVGFPDDDCWYDPGTVGQIVGAFGRDPAMGVLLGRTIDATGRESLGRFLTEGGPVDRYSVWQAGNSNSLFIRRDIAAAIDGFDEALGVGASTPFQSGEETDFVLRAMASGARAVYRPELTIRHDQVDATIGPSEVDRARRYSRGFGRVLRKHGYPAGYVVSRVARPIARSFLAAATGDRGLAAYKAAWAAGTVRGYLASDLER